MKYIAHDIRIFIRSLAGGLDSPTARTFTNVVQFQNIQCNQ